MHHLVVLCVDGKDIALDERSLVHIVHAILCAQRWPTLARLKDHSQQDADGEPIQGYFHYQWDTQMGEESFGSPDHMNDEQLAQKKLWWAQQIEEVEKEATKRDEGDEGDEQESMAAAS